jgi:formate dehydrogenase major subunit
VTSRTAAATGCRPRGRLVCPYCGVGCQLTYKIKDDKIACVRAGDGPANENRLCVKGRFGFDYVHNPER